MDETLTILTLVLSLVNAVLCAISDNWSGACGWTVAALANIDLLGK